MPDPRAELHEILAERIGAHGPLRFSDYIDEVLYGPFGFYQRGGQAGRRGDFLTSAEVGPLFGSCVGRALDRCWQSLGRPDPFTVVEHGAGPGTLARSILSSPLECRTSLRYVAVELSADQRARHPDGVESVAESPTGPHVGVVVANELLDNLAFDLYRRREDGWEAVVVDVAEHGFRLVAGPAAPAAVESRLDTVVPDAAPGLLVPDQVGAQTWLAVQLNRLERGLVIVIDYAASTAELTARDGLGWLRTYQGHQKGVDPLVDVGQQDITTDVAIDQLALIAPPRRLMSQRDWLIELGIEALVAEGRQIWAERAAVGDLESLRARSRVNEAEALLDPSGLGGFTVVEWAVAPVL